MTNTGSAAPLRPALSEPHGELPGDVGAWLLTGQGPLNAAERALAASMKDRDRHWPARLGKVLKAALGQEIVAALRTVLEQSVVDILIEGWGRHSALLAAAHATASGPDEETTVDLVEHTIRWQQEPAVEFFRDQIYLLALTGQLELTFKLGEVVAKVRSGRLISVAAGNSSVTGVVVLEGVEIARRTRPFPPDYVLKLGAGIELTHPVSRLMDAA